MPAFPRWNLDADVWLSACAATVQACLLANLEAGWEDSNCSFIVADFTT